MVQRQASQTLSLEPSHAMHQVQTTHRVVALVVAAAEILGYGHSDSGTGVTKRNTTLTKRAPQARHSSWSRHLDKPQLVGRRESSPIQ